MCVLLYWSLCILCMFVCVISNQSTSENQVICVKPSVNLIPHCINTQQGAANTNVARLKFRGIFKQTRQQKEQGKVGVGQNMKKGGKRYRGVFIKWGGWEPLPTTIF